MLKRFPDGQSFRLSEESMWLSVGACCWGHFLSHFGEKTLVPLTLMEEQTGGVASLAVTVRM